MIFEDENQIDTTLRRKTRLSGKEKAIYIGLQAAGNVLNPMT
jgi:hypothetical protein